MEAFTLKRGKDTWTIGNGRVQRECHPTSPLALIIKDLDMQSQEHFKAVPKEKRNWRAWWKKFSQKYIIDEEPNYESIRRSGQ